MRAAAGQCLERFQDRIQMDRDCVEPGFRMQCLVPAVQALRENASGLRRDPEGGARRLDRELGGGTNDRAQGFFIAMHHGD